MTKPEHQNNFNLLRFFFASLVIVSHVPELQDGNRSHEILTQIFGTISFGEMAVDSFFVLSGFLIVKSWQDRPDFVAFLSSRILRIYPGFIVTALLCALIVGPIYGETGYLQEFQPIKFSAGLVVLSLKGTSTVFPGTHYPALNGPMWSIPYEFKCYLLVLFCGLSGLLNRRWPWLVLLLVSMTVQIVNQGDIPNDPFNGYFRCGMAFAAGGCFYLYRNAIPWTRGYAWISLLVFLALLFVKPFAEPALCVFWGYAIFYYAIAGKALLGFNRFPDVSYGVYLYAWPINKILLWYYPAMNVYAAMVVVFVLAICAGSASWHGVESPFMRMKKHFRRKALQPA